MSDETKSDLSRAFSEDGELKTHVGGQALIEGIMMRGKYNWAVAVREPDGNIYIEEHDLTSGKNKHAWMRKPFIRGCTALVESLGLSFKALEIAADHAFTDEDDPKEARRQKKLADEAAKMVDEFEENFEPEDEQVNTYVVKDTCENTVEDVVSNDAEEASDSCADRSVRLSGMAAAVAADESAGCTVKAVKAADTSQAESKDDEGGLPKGVMTLSMVLGVVMGIVLFIVAPAGITNLIVGEYDTNPVLWNILDGILRVAVFIFYIWVIGRMEDIRRMFQYHGAEHKAIHCFEHGLEMTPENARRFPRLHVRCGTAFLIMVLIIAIIVYTVIPLNWLIEVTGIPDGLPKFLLVVAVRILFLPLIAGISYEITVKWAGSHPENPLVKVILWPGMQMQYLTTNEPDDEHIECAIAAMRKVLEREEREEAKGGAAIATP